MSTVEYNGILENWYIQKYPRFDGYIILGNIYGDTKGRFYEGQFIHTSLIDNKVKPKKGKIVPTLNSKYKLGMPRYD